jgi:EmrB/QacA subfamily drug resistance transporter
MNSEHPMSQTLPHQLSTHEHRARLRTTLAVASIAQFMVVLDVTIINVALPQMRADLHMSSAGQQWVVNAYALTFAGFLMLGGRAADLFGRRRVFLAGLVTFTLFSLLGGLAQNGGELIAARAAQGIGGAILAPASLSLLTATFTEHHERRRALGVWSATAASGAAGGLFIGGLLTDVLGWRWVLFVNVPIGIALVIGSVLSLSESRVDQGNQHLDVAGALTVTVGMALVVYVIVSTDTYAWGSARTVATLSAGVAVLILFVVIEAWFASNPIVPLGTFCRRSLTLANVQSTTVGAVVFGCYYFVSLYLQDVKGFSPLRTGLDFLAMGLMTFAGALVASRLVTRLGIRRQLVVAPLVTTGAAFWLSRISADSTYFGSLFVPLLLVGASIGVTFVPLTMAATMGVPPKEAGLASGLLNTSRQLGGALGLAVLATIAASATKSDFATGATHLAALTDGYTRALEVIAALSVLGAIAAWFLGADTRIGPGSTSEDGSKDSATPHVGAADEIETMR